MRHQIDDALNLLKNQVDLQIRSDITRDDIPVVRKMIQSINTECYCDGYVGFDCGSGFRRDIVKHALMELEEIEKEETECLKGKRYM